MRYLVLLLALAAPVSAQEVPNLLEERRDSRLLENRLEGRAPDLTQRARRQSEGRQREWQNATRGEYQRRLERDGRAAANAWRRTEAERFDAQDAVRMRSTLQGP